MTKLRADKVEAKVKVRRCRGGTCYYLWRLVLSLHIQYAYAKRIFRTALASSGHIQAYFQTFHLKSLSVDCHKAFNPVTLTR